MVKAATNLDLIGPVLWTILALGYGIEREKKCLPLHNGHSGREAASGLKMWPEISGSL
jgi:hypothetical protein